MDDPVLLVKSLSPFENDVTPLAVVLVAAMLTSLKALLTNALATRPSIAIDLV